MRQLKFSRGRRSSHTGSRIRAAVPKRRAVTSQPVRGLLPPRRETRMKPDQMATVRAA